MVVIHFWPGFCLFCCYQPLCGVDLGFLKLSLFTPPPPEPAATEEGVVTRSTPLSPPRDTSGVVSNVNVNLPGVDSDDQTLDVRGGGSKIGKGPRCVCVWGIMIWRGEGSKTKEISMKNIGAKVLITVWLILQDVLSHFGAPQNKEEPKKD